MLPRPGDLLAASLCLFSNDVFQLLDERKINFKKYQNGFQCLFGSLLAMET